MKKKITKIASSILIGVSVIMHIACSDNKSSGNYDGPLKLTTFYPDSGYLSSKIIIEAENLGTDVSQLSVYFNEKKGFISQAAGNILMVYAPKLPGDECVIKIVKGKESLEFEHKFRYISRFTVENVCGKANTGYNWDVDLSNTTFAAWRMQAACCDPEGNLYVCCNHPETTDGGLVMLSEKNNLSKKITGEAVNDVIYCEATKKVYGADNKRNVIYEIDPNNDWSVKRRYMKQPASPAKQVDFNKVAAIAYCPANDYFYAHTTTKQLFRFKLDDMVCEYISTDKFHSGVAFAISMKFDPTEPTKLYTVYGVTSVITEQDLSDPDGEKVYAGQFNQEADPTSKTQVINGYRTDCLLRWSKQLQIIADETGQKFMYFSDSGTATIRKIDMTTGMVTTAVGKQNESGNQAGSPEEATLSWPTGIGLTPEGDLYITDSGSGCVRKLSMR